MPSKNWKLKGSTAPGFRPTATDFPGDGIDVANASFDPGYEFGNSLVDCTEADLTQGYCSYGAAVGEGAEGKRLRRRP